MSLAVINTQRMARNGDAALAARLRAAMANAGLNATQLEQQAKLTEGYLSRPLAGKRSNIAGDRVTRIAKVCGVNPVWLMTGEGSMLAPYTAPSEPRELTVEREPQEPPLDDDENQLERVVMGFGVSRDYKLADIEAARRVARHAHRWVKQHASLDDIARAYLDAAKALRLEGAAVDVTNVAVRASALLSSASPQHIANASADENERARRELDELRNPPPKKSR